MRGGVRRAFRSPRAGLGGEGCPARGLGAGRLHGGHRPLRRAGCRGRTRCDAGSSGKPRAGCGGAGLAGTYGPGPYRPPAVSALGTARCAEAVPGPVTHGGPGRRGSGQYGRAARSGEHRPSSPWAPSATPRHVPASEPAEGPGPRGLPGPRPRKKPRRRTTCTHHHRGRVHKSPDPQAEMPSIRANASSAPYGCKYGSQRGSLWPVPMMRQASPVGGAGLWRRRHPISTR